LSALDATIEIVESPNGSESALIQLAENVDAIATCWAQTTAAVINVSDRLKIISRYGIGLDNIDIDAATQRGVIVTNVPDYCTAEVADHTMALLLAWSRNISRYDADMKNGIYDRNAVSVMHRLHDQQLGLIGFGPIARAVYERAKPFGLSCVATTPSLNDYNTGCQMVPLPELLATSDYVVLLSPLNSETDELINANTLRQMKPTACIINTSRGGLINTADLLHALQNEQIAGVCLDVFDDEPPDLSHLLYNSQRVIISPHAAFLTEESMIELRRREMQHVVAVLQNRQPPHIVNPEVLG